MKRAPIGGPLHIVMPQPPPACFYSAPPAWNPAAVDKALLIVFPVAGLSAGRDHEALLLLMVAGTIVRLLAEALHDALYSARQDAACIRIWILGLMIAPLVTFSCLRLFGLTGAGLQLAVSGGLLRALRYAALRPVLKERHRP